MDEAVRSEASRAATMVRLSGVGVRLGGRRVLSELEWSLRQGQHWAVLGGNGAGKTTFLRLVRGEIWPVPGVGERLYFRRGFASRSPIGFRERTGMVSPELAELYRRREWDLTGFEVALTGVYGTPLIYQEPRPEHVRAAERALDRVGAASLAGSSILRMSEGEARLVLLARALANNPEVLFLDEFTDGLDKRLRNRALELLGECARSGVQIVLATHRREEIIDCVSHVAVLEAGRLRHAGARARVMDALEETAETGRNRTSSGQSAPLARTPLPASHQEGSLKDSLREPLIRVENADVMLDGFHVLRGVDFSILPGEHWAVLGENGSGKSTLLRLLAGDLHPAPGGVVRRFGLERQSLWDIRGGIGLVSSSLQADFDRNATGLEAVLTGFHGHLGAHASSTPPQHDRALRLMDSLGLGGLAGRRLGEMSYGQRRKLLILRALVHEPRILLLDEPMSGLDRLARAEVLRLLERTAARGVQLVVVSHHRGDLPDAVNRLLRLEGGRVVSAGPREDGENSGYGLVSNGGEGYPRPENS